MSKQPEQDYKSQPTKEEIEHSYGPIGSSQAPPPKVIAERQKPKFIIDPKEVEPTDDIRVRKWAKVIMGKHESKFDKEWKDYQIIASGDVEPEDIDIRNIYPFYDMHWIIYKSNKLHHIILMGNAPVVGSKGIILCKVSFAYIKK